MHIAAIAALVVVTFLILQPEIGVAAVAAEAAEAETASTLLTGVAGDMLVDSAATAAETALESGAEFVAKQAIMGAM